MEKIYSYEYKYAKAKKRIEKIKGFYIHLLVTIVLIPFLIFINLRFVPQFHWFWFPVMGMSIGLFFHWLGAFGFDKLGFSKDWEEKKIKEYLDKN
ncbi:2TM domain-containing protein [Tenacibaculum sp. nBUS_03]|uniref:2TM domain-containing protein n=1 Tax=Tenacibaculum sp. nBUS_03 TaxID=3395320 RepID=UPI003EBEF6C2